MPPKYIPKKGDLITLSFDPQSGHEQKGRRPALLIKEVIANHQGWAAAFLFVPRLRITGQGDQVTFLGYIFRGHLPVLSSDRLPK